MSSRPSISASEPATARRSITAGARLSPAFAWPFPLPSAALASGIVLAIVAFANVPPIENQSWRWLASLQSFFTDVYEDTSVWILIAMVAAGLGLEKIIPARRQPMANAALNIPFALMLLLFISAIAPFKVLVAETMVGWIGQSKIINLSFETVDSVPLTFAAVIVGALILDFFFYWFHRLQHANRFLWQEHLLHHSDTALNVTTTDRNHFLEQFLTPFFLIVPVMLLFDLPVADVVIIGLLPAIWSNVVHMNIRVGFGKLWWLLTSPQYHRIHHSILSEHQNRNFAAWFPVWDVIFGTAYAPRANEYPNTGVAGIEVSSLSGAVMLPFVRWYRMAAGDLGGESARRSGT
ncbi:MAG: sterol desaturase family protein [Rhizobiales bacterium]|nr:sterol desaturase family protein [Hyphomicrobiales bacterium]